jgi:hypothetical protein
MRVHQFVLASRVFKLWKNPNGLRCDLQSRATRARVARISANAARIRVAAVVKCDPIFVAA